MNQIYQQALDESYNQVFYFDILNYDYDLGLVTKHNPTNEFAIALNKYKSGNEKNLFLIIEHLLQKNKSAEMLMN